MATAPLTHEVLRPFPCDGRTLKRGDRVAASGWRTIRLLEEQRYVRPLLPADLADDGKGKSAPKGKE